MRHLRCLNCAGVFHSLTDLFSSQKAWHGAMFKLLPEYGARGMNWSSFPEEPYVRDAELECPGCGSPYSRTSIKIIEVKDEEKKETRAKEPEGKPKGKDKK